MKRSISDVYLTFLTNTTGDVTIDADLEYIRRLDWKATSVGCMTTWPSELLVLVNLAMLSPQPQLFLLGRDSIILYNTAYGRLLRDHHPQYQGRPIAMNTALNVNAVNIDRIRKHAKTLLEPANENQVPFFFLNNGMLEEVLLSATMVRLPMSLEGFHATTYDTTAEAVRIRRDEAYNQICQKLSTATDMNSLWRCLLESLEASSDVIPFALAYSAQSKLVQSEETGLTFRRYDQDMFHLKGSAGTFDIAPKSQVRLSDASLDETWLPAVKNAISTRATTLLHAETDSLPENFCRASRDRGYGGDCTLAIVMPGSLNQAVPVHGFLVLGISPYRPYDHVYQSWLKSLNTALANALMTLAVSESSRFARENEQRQAEREREMIAMELARKRHEAALAKSRMKFMVQIMELSRVAEFESLASGVVTSANDAFYDLFDNKKRSVAEGTINFKHFCHPEDEDLLSSQWKLLLEDHSATFEIRSISSTGSIKRIQVACVLMLEDPLEDSRIAGCIIDVTAKEIAEREARERAKATADLRLSEARLSKFIETAPMGIMILDTSKQVTFMNKNWLKISRHPPTHGEQIDLHSFILPEDVTVFDQNLDKLLRDSQSVQFEIRIRHVGMAPKQDLDGHAWVMITAFPDVVDDSVHQIMVAMTDINHFKLAESMQRARLEEVVQAKLQQERFVDMTSHEIRNPLGAVLHCSDEMCEILAKMDQACQPAASDQATPISLSILQELQKQLLETVNIIISCTTHQKRIVDDLLSLSKLDSNLLEICPTPFNVKTFMYQIVKTFSAEAERSKVALVMNLDPSIETENLQQVKADSSRIMQILVNLIGNAIKFTKEGATDRVVLLSAGILHTKPIDLPATLGVTELIPLDTGVSHTFSEDEVCLWFSVRDTGCGMDDEGQRRIFKRFTQASPKTYSKYGGSGLGLFISRKLVDLQGGEIGFKSRLDEGSTFAFYIKASRTRPTLPLCDSSSESMVSASSRQSDITFDSKPLRVLLVEDNLTNQRILQKQLERKSCKVYVANNGHEAFEFIKTTQNWTATGQLQNERPVIDVILMDVEMPVMDGMQCAKLIRASQREGKLDSRLIIVAITANARAEQLAAAIDAGMDDAVSKPIRVPDLLLKIKHIMYPDQPDDQA